MPSPEDEIVDKLVLLQAIEEFSRINHKRGKIVRMLIHGLNGQDLAKAFGDDCYTGKIRIDVHRARASLREYLLQNYADDLSGSLLNLDKRRKKNKG